MALVVFLPRPENTQYKVHIFGKKSQIPEVGQVDSSTEWRPCMYAIDFQTENVLVLNKKLKMNWNFQFFILCQNTFGLKVNCT